MSRQFLMFCIAGLMGLVVDTAVLYATAPWLGWYGARLLSFFFAASTTWAVNRRFTFAAQGPEHAVDPSPVSHTLAQYLRYMASMLVGGAVNYALYVATLKGFGLHASTAWMGIELSPWLGFMGVALGSVGGLLFNFVSARYFVFAPDDDNPTDRG